jgi:hypothetical protein
MRKLLVLIAMWAVGRTVGLLPGHDATAQTWRTMTSERQVWERDPIDVNVQYGAGNLRITPAEAPTLYKMELRYNEEAFEPVVSFDQNRHVLRLGVRSPESRHNMDMQQGSTATIGLSREVPIDLDLEFGAGKATIELGDLSLQRLSVSTGASETAISFASPNRIQAERVDIEAGAASLRVTGLGNTRAAQIDFQGGVGATVLDFSGAWERNAAISVQMGVGSIQLRLPRGEGIRVDRESFLSSFDAAGLERKGESYYSSNWETAPHKLTIDLSTALGSIDIEWVD